MVVPKTGESQGGIAGLPIYFTDLLLLEGQPQPWLTKCLEIKPTGLNRKPKTFKKAGTGQGNSRRSSRLSPLYLSGELSGRFELPFQ